MSGSVVSPQRLRDLLRYEPRTGCLYWRKRSEGPVQWNAKHAGKEAFTARDSNGYHVGSVCGQRHRAHRVIWAIIHGYWPKLIDHIDGDCANNKIGNLREVSQSENMRNAAMSSRNTSGQTGVCFDKSRLKWAASIRAEGRKINLGRYDCKSGAVLARKAAEAKYNFHENHGRA